MILGLFLGGSRLIKIFLGGADAPPRFAPRIKDMPRDEGLPRPLEGTSSGGDSVGDVRRFVECGVT